MGRSELIRLIEKHERLFGGLQESQIDFFLEKNLPKHYRAKINICEGRVDWKSLKKYSDVARFYNNHFLYSMAINRFCKNNEELSFTAASFVGKGGGGGTLNSYRKLSLHDGRDVFEKVYRNGTPDIARLKFFKRFVYADLSKKIKVPGFSVNEGKDGSIVYFDWIEGLTKTSKESIIDNYRKFIIAAAAVRISAKSWKDLDPIVTDFAADPRVVSGLERAAVWLRNKATLGYSCFLEKIKLFMQNIPINDRVFSHGDLAPANIGSDGVFMDFDRCGYYPFGYDLAYICSYFVRFRDWRTVEAYLQEDIGVLTQNQRISFLFFAFLFYCRTLESDPASRLLSELWSALVSAANALDIK